MHARPGRVAPVLLGDAHHHREGPAPLGDGPRDGVARVPPGVAGALLRGGTVPVSSTQVPVVASAAPFDVVGAAESTFTLVIG
ncbi:hypothetical protein [Actinosynnema mirum]|uniref:Uncharacterized protein n=1 Tax=Actinosynnema mirum (strain ATCC 29888 / DSM 43827 / JCM 3225 / NBRC 14064 / NCIMB 13271 / NRRL B-12336 / IMRU 3971 / 101) TaxID=446462 RepID=C6WIN5_ACTMD|nr:hypothetical protein [Actinosynnema mirum]ACU38125.1 hypothetical protein Amir_4271 [Actinosynnema mirum DSM 43827]